MITNPSFQLAEGVVVLKKHEKSKQLAQQMTLDEFLKAKKIPGISGIDTRALTKIIRKHGTDACNLDSCWR